MVKPAFKWDLGGMPEKAVAMATFYSSMISSMTQNQTVYNKLTKSGAKMITNYFEAYIDHLARANPKAYHHLYEFNSIGNKTSRLFKATIKNGQISYDFIESRKPNEDGYTFSRKAFIMESGTPVEIFPRESSLLAYEMDGDMVFSRYSYVENPGGEDVVNSFTKTFEKFFSSKLPEVALKEGGFYDTVIGGIEREVKSKGESVAKTKSSSSAKTRGLESAIKIARDLEVESGS